MALDRVTVKMTQCPVGQGGFFCGKLTCGDNSFRWVYDCGANRSLTPELKREIEDKIPKGCTVDMLYLSHLDSDHISGIDQLLKRCKVKKIVLPYLNEGDRYFTLLHHFDLSVAQDRHFIFAHELIMNPMQFCAARGIEALIQVQAVPVKSEDDDGGEEGSETSAGEEPPSSEGSPASAEELEETWRPELEPVPFADSSSGSRSGSKPKVKAYIAVSSAVASVRIQDPFFDWEFVSHVYPMTGKQYNKFMSEVSNITGKNPKRKLRDNEIYDISDSIEKLKRLNACYKTAVREVNRVSMSLYTGPKINVANQRTNLYDNIYVYYGGYTHLSYGPISCRIDNTINGHVVFKPKGSVKDPNMPVIYTRGFQGGWILTGDAELKNPDRFQSFANRYRNYRSSINVVMVPHHGSDKNSNEAFFDFFDHFFITYAAAGPGNNYNHPSAAIVRMACASAPFHVVGTAQSSELTLRSEWQFW